MTKLVVLKNGIEVIRQDLAEDQKYIVGRHSDCDIQLPKEKGISRQHLVIHHQNGHWTVELLSQTGKLLHKGESTNKVEVSDDELEFSAPPYTFHLIPQMPQHPEVSDPQDLVSQDSERDIDIEIDANATDNIEHETTPQSSKPIVMDTTANTAATYVGSLLLEPHLFVSNSTSGESYQLKLDGDLWTIGRHPNCEIVIDDSAISRQHLTIEKIDGRFYLKDLGSSNGTTVNGDRVSEGSKTPLYSGDTIEIRNIRILFQIHDPNHDKKLALTEPMETDADNLSGMPAAIRLDTPDKLQKIKKWAILASPLLLILALFWGGTPEKQTDLQSSSPTSPESPTKNLEEAEHLLSVAKNHYINRNYSFCLTQLEKLHTLVPAFEDSKELERYCAQAIELEKEQADRAAKEQKRNEIQAKIKAIVDKCRLQSTTSTASTEMRQCLQPALELDPENPEALSLVETIESRELSERQRKSQLAAQKARQSAGKQLAAKALRLYKEGNLKTARSLYKKYLDGSYGLSDEDTHAQRNIAAIDQKISEKIQTEIDGCTKLLADKNFKSAFEACNRALALDPNNESAKTARSKVEKSLRIEMKKIWDSSVLEESFGNLESAKARWRDILEKSVPGENYHSKAKNKLQAYGVE